jgi:hypothetical protein
MRIVFGIMPWELGQVLVSRITGQVIVASLKRGSGSRQLLPRWLKHTHHQQSLSLDNSGGAKQTTRMEMHLRLLRPTILLQTLATGHCLRLFGEEPILIYRTC